MKKKALVAAILAATTLSATPAFAAQNPFKDMPEGHWAYDAVNMLVKDGVVEGYGDGTFGGDKLMNRYEMAEIVANAAKKYGSVGMKDKGAIKKLQREFKAELKDMDARLAGVEQDVAQLKKGQSSFKWFGDARFRYMQNKKMEMKSTQPKQWQLEKRVRLGLWGEPAKNISVEGRLKYEDEFMKHDGWGGNNQSLWDGNNSNQSSFRLDKLGVTWRNAGTAVSVGRIETSLGQGSLFWENPIDGVNVSHQFGPKLNVIIQSSSHFVPKQKELAEASSPAQFARLRLFVLLLFSCRIFLRLCRRCGKINMSKRVVKTCQCPLPHQIGLVRAVAV